MARRKIAVLLEGATLGRLDRLVRQAVFSSRSEAIRIAVEERLARLKRDRLARECAKLNPAYEKALAKGAVSEPWNTVK